MSFVRSSLLMLIDPGEWLLEVVVSKRQYIGTDVGKCTHQCSETQGKKILHKRFRQTIVFSGCKKIDNKKKKEAKEEERQGADVIF